MPINIGIDISSDKIGLLKPFFEMHFIKWRPFSKMAAILLPAGCQSANNVFHVQ